MKHYTSLAVCTALAAILSAVAEDAYAQATNGDLFYTTFNGGRNVHTVHYDYNGAGAFTLSSNRNILSVNGADGIVFAPDGDLLVGGQGRRLHKFHPNGTGLVTIDPGVPAYHLSVDPTGTKVWASSIPGTPSEISLSPFGNATVRPLTGDNRFIDTLAWSNNADPLHAFYTSSGGGGHGDFGTIDLGTFTTRRLMSNVAAAHGMTYDPYTRNLILFGDNNVTQIDPVTHQIVSDLSVPGNINFDQGTVDGLGHAFVADNNGKLLFLDYSTSRLVGSASNFAALPFLANFLDDIAPLIGPGSPPVPEPGALALLAVFSLSGIVLARKRRVRK